ncbi:MAG: hypothetical protein KAT15_27495, partial [Bacteroidales bacterium]|nr:hypothetical protein [Bacteroidales bacterium]
MVILLASLAPVFIILFYIYFRDKYDREPVRLLIMAIVSGVIIVVPVVVVERLLMRIMPPVG